MNIIRKIATVLLIIIIVLFSFCTYSYLTNSNSNNNNNDTKMNEKRIDKDTSYISIDESVMFGILASKFNDDLSNIRYYIKKSHNNKMYNITQKYYAYKDDFSFFIPNLISETDKANLNNANYTEFQCINSVCSNEDTLKTYLKEQLNMSDNYANYYFKNIKDEGLLITKDNKLYVKNISYDASGYKEEKYSRSFISSGLIYIVLDGYYSGSNKIGYNKIFKFIKDNNVFKVDGYYVKELD